MIINKIIEFIISLFRDCKVKKEDIIERQDSFRKHCSGCSKCKKEENKNNVIE